MVDDTVITHSNAPMILIPKKDGTWHPVIDFRKLNSEMIPDNFPLFVLGDLSCSILDKVFLYHRLVMEILESPSSWAQPRANCLFHSYRSFGLHSSPITFLRLRTNIFRSLIGNALMVYLDTSCQDMDIHLKRLDLVLIMCEEANLKIKIPKCQFLKSEIMFLGVTVTYMDYNKPKQSNCCKKKKKVPAPKTAEDHL